MSMKDIISSPLLLTLIIIGLLYIVGFSIVYLKKAYIDDPIFSNSKIITSIYDDTPMVSFPEDMKEKILFGGISEKDGELLAEPTGINLAKMAVYYSDGVIMGSQDIPQELASYCKESGKPVLEFDAEAVSSGSYIEDYNSFYDNLQ